MVDTVVVSVQDLIRQGDLAAAREQLQSAIRRDPACALLRVSLAEILMAAGDWDRCLNQLAVAGELDSQSLPFVLLYRSVIAAERVREQVFLGAHSPLIFGEPDPWIAGLVQALHFSARGRSAEAAPMRAQALELATASPGSVDGHSFNWIADADPRLGPVLEVIINGSYYWAPFSRIRSVSIRAPENLRDLFWAIADFRWVNGGETTGVIPVRYPGTHREQDERLRLSRLTEWRDDHAESVTGSGQKMLATDSDDWALLDVRSIEFDHPP